jgi:hypothetical protein
MSLAFVNTLLPKIYQGVRNPNIMIPMTLLQLRRNVMGSFLYNELYSNKIVTIDIFKIKVKRIYFLT